MFDTEAEPGSRTQRDFSVRRRSFDKKAKTIEEKLVPDIRAKSSYCGEDCWNKMSLTLPFKCFDDNMVLKIVNWIR